MNRINQFVSILLLAWMGIFTQMTITHLGHGHELLQTEANLCAIDCEDESHHSAGERCEWFMAKRLTDNDGIIVAIDQVPIEFESIQWTLQIFLSTASQHFVHWDRGPPVV